MSYIYSLVGVGCRFLLPIQYNIVKCRCTVVHEVFVGWPLLGRQNRAG